MKLQDRMRRFLMLICISGGILCADSPSADFTCDGKVDLRDYQVFASSWLASLEWYADGGLSSQLIAHWPLDQNALDSVSLFDGVAEGTPTWYSRNLSPDNVKIGSGAIGMSGADHLVIDADHFPSFSGSFTLEAWIKTSFTQQSQTVISRGGTAWSMGIEAETGRAFLSCSGLSGTDYLTGNTFAADDAWHHLVGVYDADNAVLVIYLDGMVDAQAFASGQVNENNSDIWIGGDPQTNAKGWHGEIDNVCVYNYAPDTAQIFNRNTYHVDGTNGLDQPLEPDPEWGKGRLKAFGTIQHAIDVAADGDLILVWPGIYEESLFYRGKAITIRSAADAAILMPDPADGIAVTFMYGEQAGSVLENFVILNSDIALYIHQSSPTLKHLTIANNLYGLDAIFNAHPQAKHCIFWDNQNADIVYDTYPPNITYSCIERPFEGEGNFSGNPLFVNPDCSDPNAMDFHLRSEYGRYLSDGQSQRPLPDHWIVDSQTSPCIDAGDPRVNPFHETMCNGGRLNIGAYGNSPFAGKSRWQLPPDMDYSGHVSAADIFFFSEQWLMASQ